MRSPRNDCTPVISNVLSESLIAWWERVFELAEEVDRRRVLQTQNKTPNADQASDAFSDSVADERTCL